MTVDALDELDLYVWEGTSDIASRAEQCLAGQGVAVMRTDPAGEVFPSRDPVRRAVALVSVSVMSDARFRGHDWLKAQALPIIWVASELRGHDPRFYPPEYSHTLPMGFTGAELRTLVFRLAGLASPPARAARQTVVPEPPLVAQSDAMRALMADVDLYASCDATVLIHGATGVGKDRIARRLHARSPRAEGPFVAVNCGAVPEGLFEAHFFGHAKGAFTGAVGAHKGYFEQAHQGTLFLDEIGDLPLHQQVKLLRVLEQGIVTRLGSTTDVPVDFRLVSATHRDLRRQVRERTFRADLYYRLAVVELDVPSLAERGPDEQAALFIALLAHALNDPSLRPPDWLTASVAAMPMPGNVRELANLAERIAIVRRQCGDWNRDRLDAVLRRAAAIRIDMDEPLDDPDEQDGERRAAAVALTAAERDERDRILSVLDTHGWRRQDTAAALGISRKVLWEKMRKYGIEAQRRVLQ